MRIATDDARSLRPPRIAPVAIIAVTLLALLAAYAFPSVAWWAGPPRRGLVGLLTVTLLGSTASFVNGRNLRDWALLDEVTWVFVLAALSVVAGATSASVSVAGALQVVALLLVATRNPSMTLAVLASACAGLVPILHAVLNPTAPAAATILFMAVVSTAFAVTLLQSRWLAAVRLERDALWRARVTGGVDRTATVATVAAAPAPARRARTQSSAGGTSERRAPTDTGDPTWDGLVERVRTAITSLAATAGVPARVQVELSGLAPPSHKMRVHLLRIVHEATTHALRYAESRSLVITLKRGEGGVLFELLDDGANGDGSRHRRALSTIRGRAAALGGTAEVRRGDTGWVTRVRLPCDQLN